jgi:copper(I)-binding protein
MTSIANRLACALLLCFLAALPANAGDDRTGNLAVTQAWSRATPGGAQVAGGYLSVENNGTLPDRLLSVSSDAAKKVEIHEMALNDGVMTMRPVTGGLIIEPGKTMKFVPGGRHLMFIGLTAPLREGDQVPVSLRFETAGEVKVAFVVKGIGAQAPNPPTRVEREMPAPAMAADDPEEAFFTHFCAEKAMANITVSPGRAGPVEIAIQLETGEEKPLTTAQAVSVTLANADKGIAPVTAHARQVGDDKWLVRMDAPQSGKWSLDLGIRLSASEVIDVGAPILIR